LKNKDSNDGLLEEEETRNVYHRAIYKEIQRDPKNCFSETSDKKAIKSYIALYDMVMS